MATIVGILAQAALWLSETTSRHWPFPSSPNISSGAALKTRQSVAVLGFKNLSANAQGEWLSTALSEMLTSELAAGAHLRTIPEENVSNLKLQLSLGDAESYGKETLGRIRQSRQRRRGRRFVSAGEGKRQGPNTARRSRAECWSQSQGKRTRRGGVPNCIAFPAPIDTCGQDPFRAPCQ